MSDWNYVLQWEHGVPFVHIIVNQFNKKVWNEMFSTVDDLLTEYGELYACVPHYNDKVIRLTKSLGATHIGDDDVVSIFCWEK